MITVKNLTKNFNSFSALKGINLRVKKGEIYGFIGQNGAGKTTTMNILAGLSRLTKGSCLVNGKDVTKIKHPSELHIGYLPEDPRFYPWLTAFEILEYLGNSGGRRVAAAGIKELLDWVGLSEAARRRVGGFSRGMKQRLGIAAALIHDPELLIFDEPASALDPEGRNDVLNLIKELKNMGKTIFFSSHILSDVERACDTVGIIIAGKMAAEKPLPEMLKEDILPSYDITLQKPIDSGILDKLSQIQGVSKVTGNELNFSVMTDAFFDTSLLFKFFVDNKLAVNSFARRQNRLEDVYLQEVNTSDQQS